jgi:hypothetical protein
MNTCEYCKHRQDKPFDTSTGIPYYLCSKYPLVVTLSDECQRDGWEQRDG